MGKGDKKSKKGKRWRGSFGVSRNLQAIRARLKRSASQKASSTTATTSEAASKPKRTVKKKAEA